DDRLEYIYKPLANHYTVLSDYQKAERLQLRAIDEAEDVGVKASFYNNLSILYCAMQAYEKSKLAAWKGLEYTNDQGYISILLYNALSATYVAMERSDSVRLYNEKALQLGRSAPKDATYAGAQIVAL